MSDRKYRQRGYQDSGAPDKKSGGEKPAKKDTFGPRPLQMPSTRDVSRCAQCGTVLQTTSGLPERCPKCGFELHSCKQCMYFDPSSHFECLQPIKVRVARKDVKNDCPSFSIRVTREKETSTPAVAKPMDARQAFENLFKK